MKLYRVEATNEQGAMVTANGRTMAEALRRFDNEYTRKGFKIVVRSASCSAGDKMVVVKKTFR